MKKTSAVVAVVMSVALAAPAHAADPARSMADLNERIDPGTEIDVTDREGRVVRGGFGHADNDGVLVTLYGSGEGRRIPAGDVMNVTRSGDSLKNGMLIGAAVGAVAGALITIDDGSSGYEPVCSEGDGGCKAGWVVLSVAMYTGFGALIDKLVKGRQVVYRAPSDRVSLSVIPHPLPRGAGVRVAVQF